MHNSLSTHTFHFIFKCTNAHVIELKKNSILVKVSTRGDTVYTFSSIEKEEYSRLYDFFKAKKIAVKSVSY